MEIRNKIFRAEMKKAGLEKVQLTKDNGMFTIWSEDEETALEIVGMYDSSIAGVFAFNQLSIKQWVEAIKDLFREGEICDYDARGCYQKIFLKD